MTPERVEVNDRMQRGYVYVRTEPAGRNFRPDFRPEVTPKRMLELGVFGGRYMTDCGPDGTTGPPSSPRRAGWT